MTESSDPFVSSLVEDLAPVKPVKPLRTVFFGIMAIAALWVAFSLGTQSEPLGAANLLDDAVYSVTCLGLFILGVGGTLSALASGRPGRDGLGKLGQGVAGAGLAVAVVAALLGMWNLSLALFSSPPGWDGMCFRQGLKLSIVPVVVVSAAVLRGWTRASPLLAFTAMVAGGAFGGLIVNLGCDFVQPQHLLLGHLTVPIAVGLVGVIPLALLLRKLHE